jgi:hypothetical protein
MVLQKSKLIHNLGAEESLLLDEILENQHLACQL